MARAYADAFAAEQRDSTFATAYLDLLDAAVANPSAPRALGAGLAAIGALATGTLPGHEALGPHAIAYRSRDGLVETVRRLQGAWAAAGGAGTARPSETRAILRERVAAALYELALYVGDEAAARVWGARRGCVQTATVVGPLDVNGLNSLDGPTPVPATLPLPEVFAGVSPFTPKVAPSTIQSDQCRLDVRQTIPMLGLRVVVVDLLVPRPEAIHVAWTSTSAAVVEVGGVVALRRPFEAGGRAVTRFATVVVPEGRVRVVAKVAERGDGSLLELDAFGDDGEPLVSSAPRPGDVANRAAEGASAPSFGTPVDAQSLALDVAAHLSLGDARAAEHLLESPPSEGVGLGHDPTLDLLYARAVEQAGDMPDNKALERARDATAHALAGWPTSWEARVGRARATERRKGAGTGLTEALRDLGARSDPAKSGTERPPQDPMVLAAIATVAKRGPILDVARRAYSELVARVPGAPILGAVDRSLFLRVGDEAARAACFGALRRADTTCFDTRRDNGDFRGALDELARLRRLRGAPSGLREQELGVYLIQGNMDGALRVYDSMTVGERRMVDTLGLLASRNTEAARARVARDGIEARDTPYALGALGRVLALYPDPAPRFEAETRALVLADQKSAFLPGAATAVLRHVEQYAIAATGLVHYVFYDLRRFSGTTDVAQGGAAYGPRIDGRTAPLLLRKRIYKPDGRTLEPDPAANASQSSQLSQLQPGDYVEHVVEGFALPGDIGELVLDTPDLLPERTSVREAVIEIRRARSIPFAVWSHPLLGTPTVRMDGADRVDVFRLENQPPRRIEDGVPRTEQAVSVSLSTLTWGHVARAFQEYVRSMDENDPTVSRWIHEAKGTDPDGSKALVNRVVAAAGKTVKVANAQELTDAAALFDGGSQGTTARMTIEQQTGSRSWLIYRALRELHVNANLAIAETEPWSSAPGDGKPTAAAAMSGAASTAEVSFPTHVGRFRHPLVVAHLDGGAGDVWIDADVDGPPLPPGRISPELRGRIALLDTGAMVTVDGTSGETGDEIDVGLRVDEKGDAKGTFTARLHGRTAQTLADSFETVAGTERTELLRNVVLGWLPWADVEEVSVSSTEGSWEIALRATIAIHGFGRPEGRRGRTWVLAGLEPVHAMVPRAGVSTLGATYASRGARQNALSIEAPIQYHFHRRIDLPSGSTIPVAPAAVRVSDVRVQAQRKTTVSGSRVEEDFTLNLPTGTVTPAAYQAFVGQVQTIDDGFLAGLRVRVKP